MEKHRAIQSQIHSVIINRDEITDQAEINKQIFFYQSFFSHKVQIQIDEMEAYLEIIPLPKLSNEQTYEHVISYEGMMSEDEVFKSLKLVSAFFYEIFIFSPNDSPSKTMKNVFYFI